MPSISLKGYASLAAGLLWLLVALGSRMTNVAETIVAPDRDGISDLLVLPPQIGPAAAMSY